MTTNAQHEKSEEIKIAVQIELRDNVGCLVCAHEIIVDSGHAAAKTS